MRSGNRLLHIRLEDIAVSKTQLKRQILEDPVLSKVVRCIQNGWPLSKTEVQEQELHTFFEKRLELSYEEKLLLWQGRLIIPASLRKSVMEVLHEGHPGITGMRSVARCHVWWPKMDADIELHVKTCRTCQQNRPREQEVPLYSWTVPQEPWSRVHIDFCGPFQNKYWLIVIDATTKWLEVFPMERITSAKTIHLLRELFARCGLPRTIVSDNGPQLTSVEFKSFCKDNNITHITSSPYHPKTNGLAEREVRTFKARMKALGKVKDANLRLQKFLFSYRITPQKTTGRSPSELFYGRTILSRLDLLKPSVETKIDNSLVSQKIAHDKRARTREFGEGEAVWVEDPLKHTFIEGIVKKKTGILSYTVEVEGIEKRKHADQLRKRVI
uniref:RNA-directed DNA polymerase n=1 Tax=Lygus hesperus TaxID=30085 RepID=A0A0A9W822_LYGHE